MDAIDDRKERGAAGEWVLHEDGLEHARTGYFIHRDALAARRDDGHWEWPLHMAEKAWCATAPFRAAFLKALEVFAIPVDARLSVSFMIAEGGRAAPPRDRGFVRLGACLAQPEASGRAAARRSRPSRRVETARRERAPAPMAEVGA